MQVTALERLARQSLCRLYDHRLARWLLAYLPGLSETICVKIVNLCIERTCVDVLGSGESDVGMPHLF
jgi:hypothetical protein